MVEPGFIRCQQHDEGRLAACRRGVCRKIGGAQPSGNQCPGSEPRDEELHRERFQYTGCYVVWITE